MKYLAKFEKSINFAIAKGENLDAERFVSSTE